MFGALLTALLFCSAAAVAQDIDFDDITMTVVGDGMFEARQLPRPSSDAIREFMETNRGALPDLAEPGQEIPGQEGPGQEGPGQEGPGQEGPGQDRRAQFDSPPTPEDLQQLSGLRPTGGRPDTQSARNAVESGKRDAVSELRNQRPGPRDQRNERPARSPRPGGRD